MSLHRMAARALGPALVCGVLGVVGCSSQDLPPAQTGIGTVLDGSIVALKDGSTAGDERSSPDAPASEGAADATGAADAARDAVVGDATGDATIEDAGSDAVPVEAGPSADAGPACSSGCVHGTCIGAGGCACSMGWGGALCDMPTIAVGPGMPATGTVTRGGFTYFAFTGQASGLDVTLTETATVGLVWAYLAAGQPPTATTNLSSDENTQSATHTLSYTFASSGTQTWYVGAYGAAAIPSPTQAVAFGVSITVVP